MTPRVRTLWLHQLEYRQPDAAVFRALAESRARRRRHMRRRALLRWLLSREVRIAIAVILAGLVILASAFAEGGGLDPCPTGGDSGGAALLGPDAFARCRDEEIAQLRRDAGHLKVAAGLVLLVASLVLLRYVRHVDLEPESEGQVTPREPWK